MARRRRGPARWPLVALAVAFVVGGAIALVARDIADGGAPEPLEVPLEEVTGSPAPVTVSRRPYSVTYRVEGYTADGGAIVDTERRWVRPPFDSRVETLPGSVDEDDDEVAPTFVQVATFGVLQTGGAVLATEPQVAAGDAVLDTSALEFQGQARTVLDRRCQVFRAAGPIDVGTVEAAEDASDTWADLCVDETGLLLHEEWVIGGRVFRRRIAVAIDESPALSDSRFEPAGERPEGPGGGVLAEVTRDSQPPDVAFWTLPSSPPGFTYRGRFGFTPPRGAAQVDQPEPTRVALLLDVYEDGEGGLLVVANGTTHDLSTVVEVSEDGEVVDLGPALGRGEVVRGLRQQEVKVGFDRGRFLRVWGTLPAAELVALTRTLTPSTDPDGTVTPVD